MIVDISYIWTTSISSDSKNSATLFLNSHSEIENLKHYEDPEEDVICPISGSVIRNPIMLNGHCYEKDSLTSWLNLKKIDPLTNLPITDNDLNTDIPYNLLRKRNLQYINKKQYNVEINRVTVDFETKKIMFLIKDTKKSINVCFNQIISYTIQGLCCNCCSLEILLESKIDSKPSTIYIMKSNLATTLEKYLNKYFKPDDNDPFIQDDFDL